MLGYVGGGFSFAQFNQVNCVIGTSGQPPGTATGVILPEQTYGGFFIGGGVEYMFLPGWSVKGEYRYASYGDKTISQVCKSASNCFVGANLSEGLEILTCRQSALRWCGNSILAALGLPR